MVDAKVVQPGTFYSNKDSKKLIVYYLPEDAQVTPQTTTTQAAQIQQPETTTEAVMTQPVQTEPTPQPTEPPVIIIEPTEPETQPPTQGEFGEW